MLSNHAAENALGTSEYFCLSVAERRKLMPPFLSWNDMLGSANYTAKLEELA